MTLLISRQKTTNPDGTFKLAAYNASGQITDLTNEIGKSIEFTYDDSGKETGAIDSTGGQSSLLYEYGLLRLMTDTAGRPTKLEYDLKGRLVRLIDPLGAIYTTEYDSNDRVIGQTDANGNTTRYEYDANQRRIKTINAVGFATQTVYDAMGNVIQRIDSSGATTSYTYDALNRWISTTHPDGNGFQVGYDVLGRVTSRTGARNEVTQYLYDPAGQMLQMIDPMQGIYGWTYDDLGKRHRDNRPTRECYHSHLRQSKSTNTSVRCRRFRDTVRTG